MSPRSLRVLVADDVRALRELVREILESEPGFEVVGSASDGEEALALLRSTKPDLLLLDLSMPRMDGLEVLQRARAASPGTRILVFSGFTAERMAQETARLGAVGYIEKGARPQDLLRSVREACADLLAAP